MKSFIFWISGLIIGALAGYLTAMYFGLNYIIAVSCGLVLGSTTAITINILRSHDEEHIPVREKATQGKKDPD